MASTDLEEFRDLSMNQRVSHQVVSDLRSEGGDLFGDAFKKLEWHGLFRPDYLRTEGTLQIADVADLDVDLVESFSHFGQNSMISRGLANHPSKKL